MGPARERIAIPALQPGKLCRLAVALGANRFSYEEARASLGSISNLYCFYKLEHPEITVVSMKGFVSDPIATERAILSEISKSVSRPHMARAIFDALVEAFQRMAGESRAVRIVRINGFGTMVPQGEPNLWTLTVELPELSAMSFEPPRREAAS